MDKKEQIAINMDFKTQIEILFNSALSLNNEHIIFDIGEIDSELAQKIKQITNYDLSGYKISIDN